MSAPRKRVDRLVRVADDAARSGASPPSSCSSTVLRVVRVLVLVDEDVAERLLPALARLGEALQHVDGEHQQVVEVDGVRGEEPALVEAVDVGDGLVVEATRRAPRTRPGRSAGSSRSRSASGCRAGRSASGRGRAPRGRLDEPHLVGLVVDREVRAVAEPLGLAAQDSPAGGVEGEDPDRAGDRPEHPLEALAHLLRGLVREGDREDLVRLDARPRRAGARRGG